LAHIVESGDSLWSIAARYNLSLADLLAFNGMTEDSFLGIGDEIMIVSPTPTATPTLTPSDTPEMRETAVSGTHTPQPTPAQIMPSPTARPMSALQATPLPANVEAGAGDVLGIGAMAFGVGLVVIAVIGVAYLRRD
jgi:murein DD-endopeptidase MepM/ murein hydrolase activator NlpD